MITDANRAIIQRAARILTSPAANALRFRLDNITIHSYMMGYLATRLTDDRVHVTVDSSRSNHYDPGTDTINWNSTSVTDPTIVHESVHAVIDATHVGQTVSVATGEAVAYVAESLYAMNAGDDDHTIDDRNLMRASYVLARQIRAFNTANPSGVFVCPANLVADVKAALMGSALAQPWKTTYLQDGIYEGPRRGLIGMMWLEDQRARK
jgi:hypothetical protein